MAEGHISIRHFGDNLDCRKASPTQETNRTRVSETQQQSFSCDISRDAIDVTHDAIDATPPSKRAKFFFHRCFDATFNPSKISGAERVLAPDSDDDVDDARK